MKQKVVIRVSMGDHHKCRSKALKTAVSVSGVDSVELQGPEKDELLVIGEIDAVNLATLLKKNVGPSEIVSVGPADQKKEEEKKEDEKKDANVDKIEVPPLCNYTMHPHYVVCDVVSYHEPSCSIM